jgi:hypothetical protein
MFWNEVGEKPLNNKTTTNELVTLKEFGTTLRTQSTIDAFMYVHMASIRDYTCEILGMMD